jgi:hypothetical protein
MVGGQVGLSGRLMWAELDGHLTASGSPREARRGCPSEAHRGRPREGLMGVPKREIGRPRGLVWSRCGPT